MQHREELKPYGNTNMKKISAKSVPLDFHLSKLAKKN